MARQNSIQFRYASRDRARQAMRVPLGKRRRVGEAFGNELAECTELS